MFQQFEKYFFIIKESKHEAEHSTSYFTANTTDIRLFWTVFWHAFIIEVLDYYFDGIYFNHYSAGLLIVAWMGGAPQNTVKIQKFVFEFLKVFNDF